MEAYLLGLRLQEYFLRERKENNHKYDWQIYILSAAESKEPRNDVDCRYKYKKGQNMVGFVFVFGK